jgi:hypothetical protein
MADEMEKSGENFKLCKVIVLCGGMNAPEI